MMARSGPWCHGEARNGGHPDWLVAKSKSEGFALRSTDPSRWSRFHLFLEQSLNLLCRSLLYIEYLSYVHGWYSFLAKQMDGLYFKDGGPVTLVQVYLYFAMHPRAEG